MAVKRESSPIRSLCREWLKNHYCDFPSGVHAEGSFSWFIPFKMPHPAIRPEGKKITLCAFGYDQQEIVSIVLEVPLSESHQKFLSGEVPDEFHFQLRKLGLENLIGISFSVNEDDVPVNLRFESMCYYDEMPSKKDLFTSIDKLIYTFPVAGAIIQKYCDVNT